MMNTIDKLTAFLPKFENEQCVLGLVGWAPDYADFVKEFFLELVSREFCDKNYADNDIPELEALTADDNYIAQAGIDQCKTLLTLIARGEKFCDGYWRDAIEDDRVQALLRRLAELRKEG
jgi:hypothetical protein